MTYCREMSHFGRFEIEGTDAVQLLHHLTTNNIKRMQNGDGCDAVLINNKARVLDWLTVWRRDKKLRVLTSPNRREIFGPHAQKFVLYKQDVRFRDTSNDTILAGIFGDGINEVLASWNASSLLDAPLNSRLTFEIQGEKVALSQTRRLPGNGVLLECENRELHNRLIDNSNLILCDDATYNTRRVEAGIPVTGLELTEDINPWEANLDFAISLEKGCYNGQEVVARLNTYQKIKQKLFGLKLQNLLSMQQVTYDRIRLQCDNRDAGFLTSSVQSERFGAIALGYVRAEFQDVGRELRVLCEPPQSAVVCALPFEAAS